MSANDSNVALDISRAPRGVLVATQLVESVAQIGDLAERHYLEVKGPEDLNSKANKQKVAKFILGAANRMPDKAAEAFEGCAVMILGITRAGIAGLPPIEMLELNKVVEQHTGPNGPRWDIVRVPVKDSSNEVLVIVVEPPQMGQPAWICRASGDGLTDGRVYIRADGETREATSAEQDLLRERGVTATAGPVELDVQVVGKVTPIYVDETRTLEDYAATTRTRLLDALPKPTPKVDVVSVDAPKGFKASPGTSLADYAKMSESLARAAQSVMASSMFDSIPEERTEDQYRKQIDDWEAELRAAWPEIVLEFSSYINSQNEIEVVNKTTTFLHDVEVNVHLDGDVTTVEPRETPDRIPDLDIELPQPPRIWGPQQKNLGLNLGYNPALYSPHINPGNFSPSSSNWRNSGSVDVDVTVGDLRPKAMFRTDDDEAVLVVIGAAPNKVTGAWNATVRGYNEIFTGELIVEVAELRDLTSAVRAYLGLKGEDVEAAGEDDRA